MCHAGGTRPELDGIHRSVDAADGATNREAAAKLFVSEVPIKTHLLHIYAKLGVSDRAAAVAAAFQRGLLGGRQTR